MSVGEIFHWAFHALEGLLVITLSLDWMHENDRRRRARERRRLERLKKEEGDLYGVAQNDF